MISSWFTIVQIINDGRPTLLTFGIWVANLNNKLFFLRKERKFIFTINYLL